VIAVRSSTKLGGVLGVAVAVASVLAGLFGVAPALAAKPWWSLSSDTAPATLQQGQAADEVREVKISGTSGDDFSFEVERSGEGGVLAETPVNSLLMPRTKKCRRVWKPSSARATWW
jgi:hypothetical protein